MAKKERVIVAMSGGVDSSVTAALMLQQGYDVVGVTLQLYDAGTFANKTGTCCAGQDIYDARRVADFLGFPHYVLDYEELFRNEVIETFADSYVKGETPIPCVSCNQTVKFRDLLKTAKDLGGDMLATGHYVRLYHKEKGPELYMSLDKNRDQSYFLFGTTREQLDYVRFPLGDFEKPKIRQIAEELGVPTAKKADSQDICFVQNTHYSDIVSKLRPGAIEPGDIVHIDGRVLGQHNGIIEYTIGQRRGLAIGGHADPLYVIALDADKKQVIVGPREALAQSVVHVRDVNWIYEERGPLQMDVFVKLRSAQKPVPAKLDLDADSKTALLTLYTPQTSGIAPGQAAVMYAEDERLLGGGFITKKD